MAALEALLFDRLIIVFLCISTCRREILVRQIQTYIRIASAPQSIDLKRGGFRKTASSQRYRIRVEAVLAHQSVILLALAGARAYSFK